MSTKEVTAIALRLFSIWLLVQVVLNISSVTLLLTSVEHFHGQAVPKYLYFMLTGSFIGIGLLAAGLLWVSARSVLDRCPSAGSQGLDQDSQKFLLQLGGAYFIITSLAHLPRSFGFLTHSMEFSYINALRPFGLTFQLGIGLALMTRASHWAALFARLRGRL